MTERERASGRPPGATLLSFPHVSLKEGAGLGTTRARATGATRPLSVGYVHRRG